MRRNQTRIVREALERGELCGRWAYLEADVPNARTRVYEIADRLGMDHVSEPCKHRRPDDSAYCDYRLSPREPEQLRVAI